MNDSWLTTLINPRFDHPIMPAFPEIDLSLFYRPVWELLTLKKIQSISILGILSYFKVAERMMQTNCFILISLSVA